MISPQNDRLERLKKLNDVAEALYPDLWSILQE